MYYRTIIRWIRIAFWPAILILITVAIGAFAFQVHRARLSDRILSKIDRLVIHPPSDVTELQWAVLVYFTHNLHGSAMPQIEASYATLNDLDRLLDDAQVQNPSTELIDELWDRYSQISRSGMRYRQRYESERDEIAKRIAVEGDSYGDSGSYRDFLNSEKESVSGASASERKQEETEERSAGTRIKQP